ncbi:helix-loop-helix DNA-binding domain-containing protein [Apiospora arundinis]
MANEQQRPASQKLPAGLAGVLNPEENRDSAYFSCTDASSKHTSTASGVGINVLSPSSTSTGYHSNEKTPSPTTTNMMPQPLHSPVGSMSITSMVSPTTPGSASFTRPQSLEVNPNGASHLLNGAPDSRRESPQPINYLDTRELGTAAQPPGRYRESVYAPHFQRLPTERRPWPPEVHPKIRTAPAITGPATSNIARAAEPTKGQAWAFPEEEIQRMPSVSFHDSRRSSIAESIASSQFTTESRLPPGQRRLEDGVGNDFQQRLSTASTDFPAVHHHSLQHKQLSDLQSEESSPHSGAQPYSRTPELRVSHKLAERKRRTEMKELFEQLRDLMPQERGSKASKWEILTKAIAEHQRQQDHLKQLTAHYQNSAQESDMLRREVERLQRENGQLRAAGGQAGQPPASHAVSSQPPTDPYAQQAQYAASRPELPPCVH